MSNIEEQPQPKIKAEVAEEIYQKFGKVDKAFRMSDIGAVLLDGIVKDGWESRTQFKVHDNMISESTMEIITELEKEGYDVKIGFPSDDSADIEDRVVLYHE